MNQQMTKPLQQGATIGILGGGQLGRMLSVAASRLGFKTHIFEPGTNPPAGQVADQVTTAAYDDTSALTAFANTVDVITFEFENIPADALDTLEKIRPVLPARNALATSQDRITEKEFLTNLGVEVAPYANIESDADVTAAMQSVGAPSIMKTRRFGYDGKGQSRLKSIDDGASAWNELGNTPSVLEGFIDFSREISVIGARSQSGEVVCFDPGENVHRDGILHTTTLPASISGSQRMDAVLLTGKILNALDYVGVMGVELFVTPNGLLVNEIAPRVHNSGHWTQNGCVIDQFEQHIRAVAGWPLGNGERHSNVVMTNLIGDEVLDVETLSADASVGVHLYGKAEAKAGRKMGHVNKISPKTA
jgi:5-(carboxyamino)imidazole ribonucleotide synthase